MSAFITVWMAGFAITSSAWTCTRHYERMSTGQMVFGASFILIAWPWVLGQLLMAGKDV